jgi:hypothetical protein
MLSDIESSVFSGRIEIDNSLVENAIPPDLDRNTAVEWCRRRGIDPLAYLRDVINAPPIGANSSGVKFRKFHIRTPYGVYTSAALLRDAVPRVLDVTLTEMPKSKGKGSGRHFV